MPKWNIDREWARVRKMLQSNEYGESVSVVLMPVARMRQEKIAVTPAHEKKGFGVVRVVTVGAATFYGLTIRGAFMRLMKYAKMRARERGELRRKPKAQKSKAANSGEERRP